MKNEDFFGGIFDFNGDGKTDIIEQWAAFQIINESIERNKEKDVEPKMTSKPFDDDTPGFRMPVNLEPTKKPVPQNSRKTLWNKISAVIAAAIMLIPVLIVLFAAISSYDPDNSASGFVTLLFAVPALVIGGIIVYVAAKELK